MTDAADKSPEEQNQEIESPAGKTPDWMKLATASSNSGPSLTDENTPAWLKSIRAGKSLGKESQPANPEPTPAPPPASSSSDDSMSDLERLLAEEGIDLNAVSEERPEGSENMSARDWLIATSSEELIRSKLGAEPIPQSAPPSTPAPTGSSSSESTMSDLERLLAEEGIDLGSVAEERPNEAGGMSARDWLIATSSDELIRNKLGAEPLATPPAPTLTPPPTASPTPVDDKMVVEEDLPDWLQEIADESASPEVDLFSQSGVIDDDQLVVRDELPDWLQNIAEESTGLDTASVALPEMPETSFTSSMFDDGTIVEEELPDWLREVEDETPSVSEKAAVPEPSQSPTESGLVVEEDLPDWLRQVEEEPTLTQIEPTQASFVETPSIPTMLNEDKMVVQEDLPDWLREVEAEAPAETADSNWDDLADVTNLPLTAVDDVGTEEDLPDWLREASTVSTISESELGSSLAEADKMVVEEDLPDWLREVEAKEAEGGLLLDSVRDELISAGGEPTIAEADLPDWLREVEASETAEEELPSFETTTQGPPESVLSLAEDRLDLDEEDLPDWLREVQAEAGATPAGESPVEPLPPSLDAVKSGSDIVIEEELPDWLREAQEEIASLSVDDRQPVVAFDQESELLAGEELPDWLQEVDTDFDELFEPSEPSPELFADALPDEDLVIAEELPDWLREVEAELPEVAAEVEPPIIPAVPVVEANIPVAEEELPDWLRGVEAELPELTGETPESMLSTAEVINQADLPDWLRGVEAELPETVAEMTEPTMLVAPPVIDEIVDESGLPDWLREVETEAETVIGEELISSPEPVAVSSEPALVVESQPIEAEAVAVETPTPVEEASTSTVPEPGIVEVISAPVVETPVVAAPAGIPDWLQKLREVEPEPAPAPVFIQPVAVPAPVMVAQTAPIPIAASVVVTPDPEWPADADEQLKLARTARDKGEWDKAIPIYDTLVSKGVYLGKIIEDMQQAIKTQSNNHLLYQLMGDAMMRDGRLQSALNAYREALAKL